MASPNVTVFDSELYGPIFTDSAVKDIWSDESMVRRWLTIESAVAKVQAQLGIIPQQAAAEIDDVCSNLEIDWQQLSVDTQEVGMAIMPLIQQVNRQGSDLVKNYLHWGCTTQDLLDTGLALRLKQTFDRLRAQLVSVGDELKKMALEHRLTVMVARTNSMDALPTTWGLQVSSYLSEISRHLQRLDQLLPRATTGIFGGAVGNLSSLGQDGIKVRHALFHELGLPEPQGLGNGSMDHVVEVVQFFALIHGTLNRIANDIELMGRSALGEVREGEGGGGSSTMPHKANPRACNMIQNLARLGWMYASGAPNMLDQQDVRSASMRMLSWSVVPESVMAISTSLRRTINLLRYLVVDPGRMQRNFSHSRNLVMAESVMMVLAQKLGRDHSYCLIKQITSHDHSDLSLNELLKANAEVSQVLNETEIDRACDPASYLGSTQALIDEAVSVFDGVK